MVCMNSNKNDYNRVKVRQAEEAAVIIGKKLRKMKQFLVFVRI
ncbi:hypothetical protein KIS1582_1290 [Cytobacillus firmus]|uniref:Uncharacterized protein n=1 Tax=Cytobacillus firmus TaxID=1399 RepID=A0A800NBI6_CYTFI|nr:hypothetical protein KIS1582_1290 [Cytobacillus firmus]